ncbi:MAG TPA: hypothetical protein VK524_02305 [Polyangiaceae bacterium]|nr:hypothetical protein [Polyangiaceae bacterium]
MSTSQKPASRILCLVPDQNTPGKSDVTGAFFPEARAFARYHGCEPDQAVRRFPSAPNLSLQQRRAVCVDAIMRAPQPLDVLAFFCHGWRDGLQAGFTHSNVLVLARLIALHADRDAHVLLYACQTGRDGDAQEADDQLPGPGGDGGFADELRDACEVLGRRITVMGHTTAGHCTWNPFARYFAPGCGGLGGHWYVEPESELWQAWVRALREPRSSLRYRFPFMQPEEIADELGGGAGPLVA